MAGQSFAVIIPCASLKGDAASAARDLYVGPYFAACLAYAESIADQRSIFILSAKHGLVGLFDRLEPYDVTMKSAGAVSVDSVAAQASALGLDRLPVLILGGALYAQRALAGCPIGHALTSEMPHGRRGIGSQLGWLKAHRGKLPPAFAARLK